MSASDSYLPPTLSAGLITQLILSLDLPHPVSVEPLKVSAAFHSIYLIHFQTTAASKIAARPNHDGTVTLVLRVSGRQLPRIKTQNEVGAMTWVRRNTHIPVPNIIRYDSSEKNIIKHEFSLLEKAPGVSVDQVYHTLSEEMRTKMVHQLVNYLAELHSQPWKDGFVGGLVLSNEELVQGPPIEENFWQTPDIDKYWNGSSEGETLETLNPLALHGYLDYVSFIVASLKCYIRAIEIHPSLKPYWDLLPRIIQFIDLLQKPENAKELNQVTYVMAHKDMHFANIMCDPEHPDCPITAILDWEFSGVVPAPRWNPPRAFLWNYKTTSEDKAEQARMESIFEEICREKGLERILEETQLSPRQQDMQTAVNHIRAIVEVCPRGQAKDRVASWRSTAEKAMKSLGA
ncbi:hypothetical protein N7478_000837 [Penicillium angulare]|uniref:uncharacterized protein n=1 Tax=Penicillium angulare TaxID=116970 RepID=UPI00253FF752|nr:uncharacterized protein N7478_000837 [Penicillium angulare]KAJ5291586.1 hypothetical protein N7478_000837 [Penicillium angulare]